MYSECFSREEKGNEINPINCSTVFSYTLRRSVLRTYYYVRVSLFVKEIITPFSEFIDTLLAVEKERVKTILQVCITYLRIFNVTLRGKYIKRKGKKKPLK